MASSAHLASSVRLPLPQQILATCWSPDWKHRALYGGSRLRSAWWWSTQVGSACRTLVSGPWTCTRWKHRASRTAWREVKGTRPEQPGCRFWTMLEPKRAKQLWAKAFWHIIRTATLTWMIGHWYAIACPQEKQETESPWMMSHCHCCGMRIYVTARICLRSFGGKETTDRLVDLHGAFLALVVSKNETCWNHRIPCCRNCTGPMSSLLGHLQIIKYH